jgi:hypothetical protein
MTSAPTANSDPGDSPSSSSSLFYDAWLDYIVVALLAVEGVVAGWLGVLLVGRVDRQLADELAAEFLADPEAASFPLTEPELADALYTLLTWVGGALVGAGVLTVLVGVLFYRYRGDVRDRLADGRRPPRWHAPLLGGLLATALIFVPPAPQALGGAVAGYVSDRSAIVDGALAGLVFGAPAYLLWVAVLAAAVVGGVPALAGIAAVAMVLYLVFDVALSAIGGLVGGLLS